jgi:hypothetical protein
MIKQHSSLKDLKDDVKPRASSKVMIPDKKLGVSPDNNMVTKFTKVHPTSASIFGKHNLSSESLGKVSEPQASGLSFNNSHHKFYCHNGHRDKPKIFANFIRNTNMQDK